MTVTGAHTTGYLPAVARPEFDRGLQVVLRRAVAWTPPKVRPTVLDRHSGQALFDQGRYR